MFWSAGLAVVFCATSWGQAAQGPQWKDRAEYDLVQSIQKEADLNKRLALLNQWKEKYAQTDFAKVRAGLYLDTYHKLNQVPNMVAAANELIASDPKDIQTQAALIVLALQMNNTSPEMLGLVEKASQGVVDNIDNKPAAIADDQWKTQKNVTLALGHRGLGWVAQQRKDTAKAKEALTKSLELNPQQADVSYALGQLILGEKDPKTYPVGLFHVARAVAYEGPNALPAAAKGDIQKYLAKAYAGFHGDESGLDQVKTVAKTNALPPADFRILSVTEVAEQKNQQEQAFAAQNPRLALWKRIKDELVGENGQAYFDNSMKDAQIPQLRGWLVEQRPKELLIAISDKNTPELTLILDTPMPGKAEPGTELQFEGVGKTFSKEPFMVTMEVERKNITGWPTPAPKKPSGAKKPVKRRK